MPSKRKKNNTSPAVSTRSIDEMSSRSGPPVPAGGVSTAGGTAAPVINNAGHSHLAPHHPHHHGVNGGGAGVVGSNSYYNTPHFMGGTPPPAFFSPVIGNPTRKLSTGAVSVGSKGSIDSAGLGTDIYMSI